MVACLERNRGEPLLILMTKMAFDWFVGTREFFLAMSLFIIGWPIGHALGQSVCSSNRRETLHGIRVALDEID